MADADFLVGLEGELETLSKINEALKAPVWALSLGRKAYPPGAPVFLPEGLLPDIALEDALKQGHRILDEDLMQREDGQKGIQRQRMVVEVHEVTHELRHDNPVSFKNREFRSRYIRTSYLEATTVQETKVENFEKCHVENAPGEVDMFASFEGKPAARAKSKQPIKPVKTQQAVQLDMFAMFEGE